MTACLQGAYAGREPFPNQVLEAGAGSVGGGDRHRCWGASVWETRQVHNWSGVFFPICFFILTENVMFETKGYLANNGE